MRKKLIWTTFVIPLVVASLLMVNIGTSSPDNTIYVDPVAVWDPDMAIGTEFTVDVRVDYVSRLLIWQFHMFFDPAVIQGVSVAPGPFLASAGGNPIFYPGIGFDNENGVLYLIVQALRPPPATPPNKIPSGGGVLATVTFIKVGDGSSVIELGPDSGLIGISGDWISKGVVANGFFSNLPGPELYIRRGGSGGGPGAYPEWAVGNVGDEQTLYSSISNKGAMGADVFVKFTVTGPMATQEFETDVVWVVAADPDESRVEVSVDIGAQNVPGYYWVYAELWFKAGGMTEFAAYTDVEEALGGFGDTKSQGTPVKYKVS